MTCHLSIGSNLYPQKGEGGKQGLKAHPNHAENCRTQINRVNSDPDDSVCCCVYLKYWRSLSNMDCYSASLLPARGKKIHEICQFLCGLNHVPNAQQPKENHRSIVQCLSHLSVFCYNSCIPYTNKSINVHFATIRLACILIALQKKIANFESRSRLSQWLLRTQQTEALVSQPLYILYKTASMRMQ